VRVRTLIRLGMWSLGMKGENVTGLVMRSSYRRALAVPEFQRCSGSHHDRPSCCRILANEAQKFHWNGGRRRAGATVPDRCQ